MESESESKIEPEDAAKSNVFFLLDDVGGSLERASAQDYSMPPQHPLGAQEPFYFVCYRVLRENLDGDVFGLIFPILLSMRHSRDKLELKCAQNVYFPVENEVYCSGLSYEGQTKNIYNIMKFPLGNVIQLACGLNHSLILIGEKDGSESLYAIGVNTDGQLGLGHWFMERFVKIPFFDNGKQGKVISIHCGANFSVVLTTTGLFGFGCNEMGQVGQEVSRNQNAGLTSFMIQQLSKISLPTDMLSRTPEINHNSIKSIYVGFTNTMILMVNGTVYACGDNQHGQLGLGEDVKTPTVFKLAKVAIRNVVGIALGRGWTMFHTLGGLYASGDAKLGNSISLPPRNLFAPVRLPSASNLKVVSIKSGSNHLVVLTEEGDLYACGDNRHSKIGLGSCYGSIARLTKISTLSNVTQFQCGAQFTLAIADGKFYFWGDTTIRARKPRGARGGLPLELPYYQTLLQEAGLVPKSNMQEPSEPKIKPPVNNWGAELLASEVVWI